MSTPPTDTPASPEAPALAPAPARVDPVVPLGVFLAFASLVARRAWVSDDAFITLRTVDNLVHLRGLGWNVGERVQAYTHPLWMLLLAAVYSVTREAFFTTIAVGVATSCAAVWALASRVAVSPSHALVAALSLTVSRAFVDFSTSGLENPLTHLLSALFVVEYLRPAPARLSRLTLLTALLYTTRSDAVLLLAPALVHAAVEARRSVGARATLKTLALSSAPAWGWTLFSLFYYGFPFPNTAYAKLGSGVHWAEQSRQGAMYLLSGLMRDPVTHAATLAGVWLSLASRDLRRGLLALGVIAYLGYVVRIGGDFMHGRFFTAPLFVSACLIASAPVDLAVGHRLASAVVGLLLLGPGVQLTQRSDDTAGDVRGVVDEASFYAPTASLSATARGRTMPDHLWSMRGRALREAARTSPQALVFGNLGYLGYAAGPDVYVVDPNGLSDPLLARLPAVRRVAWRPGHMGRRVPEGYLDTMAAAHRGEPFRCRMNDPALCEYLEHLVTVTRGPLFSWGRLAEIARFNAGSHGRLIATERYRSPNLRRVPASQLSTRFAVGTAWNASGVTTFDDSGLVAEFPAPQHARRLAVGVDRNDSLRVMFLRGDELLGETSVVPVEGVGIGHVQLEVPEHAASVGYDRVAFTPTAGDGRYALGYLLPE